MYFLIILDHLKLKCGYKVDEPPKADDEPPKQKSENEDPIMKMLLKMDQRMASMENHIASSDKRLINIEIRSFCCLCHRGL